MKKTLLLIFTLLSILSFSGTVNTTTTKGAFYQWTSSTGSAVNAADVLQQIATNTSYIGQGYLGALSLTGSALILNAGVGVTGVITSLGDISTLSTTQSISIATGALIVDGGVGIKKDLYLGGKQTIINTASSGTYTALSLDNFYASGGGDEHTIEFNVRDNAGTHLLANSIGTNVISAGANDYKSDLVFKNVNGLTITEQLRIKANGGISSPSLTATSTTQSLTISDGSIIASGGAGIAKDLRVGGTIFSRNTNGYTTTTCSATITTLTSISNRYQFFTGTTTQTILLPVTSTLSTGQMWEIKNNTTNAVITVNSSGGELVQTVTPSMKGKFTCIGVTSTGAIDWDSEVNGVNYIIGSEIATNEYIDGNRVFCKVINFGAIPNNTTKNVAHGISNFDRTKIVRMNGSAYDGTKFVPFGLDSTTAANQVTWQIDSTNLTAVTVADRSGYTANRIYIFYYK